MQHGAIVAYGDDDLRRQSGDATGETTYDVELVQSSLYY
jgi:hypothetical protein